MATATVQRPLIRRSSRLQSGSRTNTFYHKPHPKRSNALQRALDSSVRRLYQHLESLLGRIEVLEQVDGEYPHVRLGSSHGTIHVQDEDVIRQLFLEMEAARARITVLEQKRDICYDKAFRAADGTHCIVRGCGAKSSSGKNDRRHFKETQTEEHQITAFFVGQTECLQCEKKWKIPAGLDHHERETHQETRSSRMDTFRPLLEQPLSCICRFQPTQSSLSAPDNLQPDIADLNQLNWSTSNDLQPLTESTPTDRPLHPPHSGAESLPMPACDDLQPNWSSSNDFQPWENDSSAYHSMQPLHSSFMPATSTPNQPEQAQAEYFRQSMAPSKDYPTQSPSSEFVFPQPNWSGFNDLHHSDHI